MRLGVHVPVAGGLLRAARRARSLRCECLQIFTRNPRGWRTRSLPEGEIAAFRALLDRHDIHPLVIHASYLINLASPDRALRDRSLRAMVEDMARGALLGARFVVMHPGHHMGAGTAAGLRRIARAVKSLLRGAPDGVDLLLENTAGRGTELGAEWQEFVHLLDLLGGDGRVGVCFDTCHAHAAGHRLDSPRWVGRTLSQFKAALALDRLRLIHLNDCRGEAGARRDLHEHIGRGTIGDRGLGAVLRRRELRDLSAILETPMPRPGDDRRNLARARRLAGRDAPSGATSRPPARTSPARPSKAAPRTRTRRR
jgi:deoxyribonuclease-4